jgi:hypothetical protein
MVHASSVIPAGIGGRSSPALGCGSGNRITFGQGAHRVRLFRRCATRNAGRHPLTTGADGAHLKWIVCRASGGYSKLARVVRISYTLSRDTTLPHCPQRKWPSYARLSCLPLVLVCSDTIRHEAATNQDHP